MRFRGTGFPSSAFRHCGAGSGGHTRLAHAACNTPHGHAGHTPQYLSRTPVRTAECGALARHVYRARPRIFPLLCLNVNVAWCVRDQTRNSDRRRKETHHTTHTHRLPCDVHLAGGNRIQNGAACASRGASNRGASNRGASIVHLSCCSSVHFSSLYTDVV